MSLVCLHPHGDSSVYHLPHPRPHLAMGYCHLPPPPSADSKLVQKRRLGQKQQTGLTLGNLELGLINYLVILKVVEFKLCELGGRGHLLCVMWVGKQNQLLVKEIQQR